MPCVSVGRCARSLPCVAFVLTSGKKKTTTAKRATVVHSLRQCTTKARTDGSSWLQHVDQQPRGLLSWPLRVGVVVLPWPSPVPTTRLCAACCEAGNPHLVHQSWGHAAHEIRSGTFFVAKLVIKNRSLRPYAQYVVPHSDFGCWLAQVLLVFTCWSAVLLHMTQNRKAVP